MTFAVSDLLSAMAVMLVLGLAFGYHWGRHAMLHLLEGHRRHGIRFDHALAYEYAMLKGERPPGPPE